MKWNIQNWIEEVKTKPEHVRQRYVIGCVAASMFFVIIVWSLTVSEQFKRATPTVASDQSESLLPKPSDFSLDEFLSGKDTIEEKAAKPSDEFLREQVESRDRINPDDEGIQPKSQPPTSDSESQSR